MRARSPSTGACCLNVAHLPCMHRYSLRNLKRVVPTKLLKDYMLPPASALDESAMRSPH